MSENGGAVPCCAAIFYYDRYAAIDPSPLADISLRHDVSPYEEASDEYEWCRTYVYPDVRPGFAEKHHENYDQVAERLSWTRSLQHMRDKFGIPPPDLEKIWMEHIECMYQPSFNHLLYHP